MDEPIENMDESVELMDESIESTSEPAEVDPIESDEEPEEDDDVAPGLSDEMRENHRMILQIQMDDAGLAMTDAHLQVFNQYHLETGEYASINYVIAMVLDQEQRQPRARVLQPVEVSMRAGPRSPSESMFNAMIDALDRGPNEFFAPLPRPPQPVRAQPVRAQPARAQPIRAQPVRAQPIRAISRGSSRRPSSNPYARPQAPSSNQNVARGQGELENLGAAIRSVSNLRSFFESMGRAIDADPISTVSEPNEDEEVLPSDDEIESSEEGEADGTSLSVYPGSVVYSYPGAGSGVFDPHANLYLPRPEARLPATGRAVSTSEVRETMFGRIAGVLNRPSSEARPNSQSRPNSRPNSRPQPRVTAVENEDNSFLGIFRNNIEREDMMDAIGRAVSAQLGSIIDEDDQSDEDEEGDELLRRLMPALRDVTKVIEDIDQIPLAMFEQITGADPDAECMICYDKFTETDIVRVLPCSHLSHRSCIDDYLKQQSHLCPYCKAPTGKYVYANM